MAGKPKLKSSRVRVYTPKGAARALFVDPRLEERANNEKEYRATLEELKGLGLSFNTEREILIEGPAGTGKSYAILQFAAMICQKYRGVRLLFTRETRASLSETILELWEENVLGVDSEVVKNGPNRENRYYYEFPKTGSRVVIIGMNNESRVMSGKYDGVIYFEGTDEQQEKRWDALLTRLRNQRIPHPLGHADAKGHLLPSAYKILKRIPPKCKTVWDLRDLGWFEDGKQLSGGRWPDGTPVFFHFGWMDTNPGHPMHWLNKRPERLRENGKKQMLRLLSRHEDNPTITADYLDVLKNLVPEQRARLYEGVWQAAEGLVYPYSDQVHLVTVPPDMAFAYTIGGLDFGFEDAGVFQIWGVNETGMYRIVEVYFTHKLQDWWASTVADFAQKYKTRRIMADPSRPEMIEAINRKLAVEGAGCRVEKANNDIHAGVDALRYGLTPGVGIKPVVYLDRFAHKLGYDPELQQAGRPSSMEEEIVSYVWDTWVPGKPYKDQPKSGQSDHGLDTARYVAIEVMKPGMIPENKVVAARQTPWQHDYCRKILTMRAKGNRRETIRRPG